MSTSKPTLPFSPSKRMIEDLQSLLEHPKQLQAVSDVAKTLGPKANINALIEKISDELDLSKPVVTKIISALNNLSIAQDKEKFSSKELFEATTDFLKLHIEEKIEKEVLSLWENEETKIVKLLDELRGDHPLSISMKAQKLTFTHQNLILGQEIITDMRPVFSQDGNRILEAVVTHSLVLQHMESNVRKETHFTMDAGDVAQLRRLCDRAERKAATLETAMADICPINIIGDESDA